LGDVPYFERGRGPYLWDLTRRRYLDFNLGFGALVHGHTPPFLGFAAARQARRGVHLAVPNRLEVETAESFLAVVRTADRVAFCTSGSEAASNAVRLARAATGRPLVVVFEGHYHLNVGATGAPAESEPSAGSAGAGEEVTPPPSSWGGLQIARYNSPESVAAILDAEGDRVAAIVLEPVMCNAGVIPPAPGFLRTLRSLADRYGALLVFDEVFSGFRVAPGGASELYGVRPDLACWSKALGAGMPIAALSGRSEFMDRLGPDGLPFGSTYSAHSLALAGTRAALEFVRAKGPRLYSELARRTVEAEDALRRAAAAGGTSVLVQSVPGALQFYRTDRRSIREFRDALEVDRSWFARAAREFLARGVYFHPDNFESLVLSSVHGPEHISELGTAAEAVFASPSPPGVPHRRRRPARARTDSLES
jgi:glutamate-1-semialdehyde 2,1-aminomutase